MDGLLPLLVAMFTAATIYRVSRGNIFLVPSRKIPVHPTPSYLLPNLLGPGLWDYREINLVNRPDDIGYYLKGFGQDLEGEIYLTVSNLLGPTGNTGQVFKLVLADKEKGNGKGKETITVMTITMVTEIITVKGKANKNKLVIT